MRRYPEVLRGKWGTKGIARGRSLGKPIYRRISSIMQNIPKSSESYRVSLRAYRSRPNLYLVLRSPERKSNT
jgi:hypothetical protein